MSKKQKVLELPVVETWDEIPEFASEAEEAEFWATHGLGESFLEEQFDEPAGFPPPRPRTKPVSVRFDADTMARLKVVAAKKGKGYQTLLKEFVAERLYEEEKREGIIG